MELDDIELKLNEFDFYEQKFPPEFIVDALRKRNKGTTIRQKKSGKRRFKASDQTQPASKRPRTRVFYISARTEELEYVLIPLLLDRRSILPR